MFYIHINPIQQYGAEIWCNGKQIDSMECLHLSYCKHILHVKRSSCTQAMYAEYDRFPIIIAQKIQVMKYWQRILKLKDNYILKHVYNSQLKL